MALSLSRAQGRSDALVLAKLLQGKHNDWKQQLRTRLA
jgi:hypothetical protein